MTGGGLWQRRALHALSKAQELGPAELSLYSSYVERLGPAVLANGLGQALATEHSAGGEGGRDLHDRLVRALESWLCQEVLSCGPQPTGPAQVLEQLCKADQATYVRAQQEALEWLDWHKRLVRAMALEGARDQAWSTAP
ncbi:MAG: type III-B CRISPR module-associated protein Cmr5 [Acidimicrobiales bacterium]